MSTLKCNNCHLVVDELLAYIQNKVSIADEECLSGKLPSPPLSIMKVNMKRGGYFDSGPIGLSQLDDTIVTTPLEQSNYETSPREYNSNYRSIDLSKAEGSNSVQFQSTVSKHSTDDCVTRAERGIMRVGTESSGTSSEPNGQLGATAQIRSFAGVAKVHNPNEGWTVVQKKSQKSKNRLIGKMGNFVVESDEKFRAADRKIPLFITNESIVSLENISIKRQCEHDAYKIFVSQSKLPLYLDENLWPQGIIFRRFLHFKLKPKLKSNETPITQVALRNLPINVKRSAQCIRELCKSSHLIALQECWLLKEELCFLDTISEDFSSTGVSAIDTSTGILRGRPYGGVALLWKRILSNQRLAPLLAAPPPWMVCAAASVRRCHSERASCTPTARSRHSTARLRSMSNNDSRFTASTNGDIYFVYLKYRQYPARRESKPQISILVSRLCCSIEAIRVERCGASIFNVKSNFVMRVDKN
ncbi:unnamed protein product [Leptidea sinapis]|uniref:Uncharacterized protein n=1 Tax=Leptidea sinapis TaxID=189913 RepID=A0A5E4Q7G2_9NEOP|nr:unnamed protein product [Leptidea sinapis]